MKQQRLVWLLVVMGALVVLRFVVPPAGQGADAVSQPVVRPAKTPSAPGSALPLAVEVEPQSDVSSPGLHALDPADISGNAFAVREAPRPPPAPPAPPVVKTAVAAAPPAPPPDPAPSLQIIGTWDDGTSPGVFVSTPAGTLLARKGAVLQSQYRVTEVTRQQLVLENTTTKRQYRLPVPR